MPATATRPKPARHASSRIGFVAEFATGAVVDRANSIVRGVRLCGPTSRNGRAYPVAVLQKAARLYEGAPCNIGHHVNEATGQPLEVPPEDRFGRFTNVRVQNGGLHADLKFNAEHRFAKQFLWAVEHDPKQFSFSHLARVKWHTKRDEQGRLVAEEILEVASIDVVSDAGTNSSVFESKQPNSGATSMYPADPKELAAQFETVGAAGGWLMDFLKALGEQFDASEMDMLNTIASSALASASTSTASNAPDPLARGMADPLADTSAEGLKRMANEWNGPGTGSRPLRGAPLDLKALANEWYH